MIICITQARMSSTRCPGKVLKPILGTPMAWHQWQRSKRAQSIDQHVLATSIDASDDPLANFFNQRNELVFRGSLDNVLSRYYECATLYKATHVVRLTADCPFTDPVIIDKTVEYHLKNDNDHTSTHLFPVGISVEVCSFKALESAYFNARLRSEREHVTLHIYQHPELFKLGKYSNSEDLSHLRWTVDYPEDFEFATQIYQRLYPQNPNFSMQDVLHLLKINPELIDINKHMKHNEGLLKSLNEDKEMTYLDK